MQIQEFLDGILTFRNGTLSRTLLVTQEFVDELL